MTEKKFYRVWNVVGKNQDGSSKYDGFTEIEAQSPEDAVRIAGDENRESGVPYDYIEGFEAERIEDLSGDGAIIEYCGEF